MLLGQITQKSYKESYTKLIVAVETGYNVDIYTLRTRNHLAVNDIDVDDQVLFTGRIVTKGEASQFQLQLIMKHGFKQCPMCHIPIITSELCLIKHDKEAQKLEGEWRVVHMIFHGNSIKIFYEKGHFVFAVVATPMHWYYKLFRNLRDGDTVTIEGWRYKQKTSIKYIQKVRAYNK